MLPVQRTDIRLLNSNGVEVAQALKPGKLKKPRLRATCRSVRTSFGTPSKLVFVQYSACSPRTFEPEPAGVSTEEDTEGGPGSRSAAESGSPPSMYSTSTFVPTRLRIPSSMLTRYVGLTRELPPPAILASASAPMMATEWSALSESGSKPLFLSRT